MRYCLSDRLIVGVDSMNIMKFTQRYGLVSLDMWTPGINKSLIGWYTVYRWYMGVYVVYGVYHI